MGVILSRFRKKKETVEVLEELDKDIKDCISFRLENQERQRRWVARFTIWGIISYLLIALLYYLIYFPDNWVERIIYSAILIVMPVILIIASRRGLIWYYAKKITSNEEKLLELKRKKEKILEEVMETETYKKAKQILEKFDPERHKTMTPPRTSYNNSTPASTPGTELRQRKGESIFPTPKAPQPPHSAALAIGPPPHSAALAIGPPPATPLVGSGTVLRLPMNTPGRPMASNHVRSLGPRGPMPKMPYTPRGPVLPRPVLPAERSVLDKMVEYLVGDGPSNRFALICRRCNRHNGMALKEEFEFLSYHCAYCQFHNPAKRTRPSAPRLPESNPPSARESEAESETDSSPSSPRPTKSGEAVAAAIEAAATESAPGRPSLDSTAEEAEDEMHEEAESDDSGGAKGGEGKEVEDVDGGPQGRGENSEVGDDPCQQGDSDVTTDPSRSGAEPDVDVPQNVTDDGIDDDSRMTEAASHLEEGKSDEADELQTYAEPMDFENQL